MAVRSLRVAVPQPVYKSTEAFTVAQWCGHVFESGQLQALFEVACIHPIIGDAHGARADFWPRRSRAVPPARMVTRHHLHPAPRNLRINRARSEAQM